MGAFEVQFQIESPSGRRLDLEGLVDTGSTYTWVPRRTLDALGIVPQYDLEFDTADGRVVKRDVAEARIRIEGASRTTQVVFADDTDSVLLGVVTLEEFSLGVDPINHRLIPVRGLAMGRRALP